MKIFVSLLLLGAFCFQPSLQANCTLCDVTFSTLNHSINVVTCPGTCWAQQSGVCGSEFYSGSICRAAMHGGRISNSGGIIEVYKHGVTDVVGNLSYGINSTTCSATLTYSFDATCNTTGDPQFGVTSLTCPPQCQAHKVCGKSPYSSQSSICAAAIHAGVINASGGKVRIIRRPGLEYYNGSSGNGIVSEDCGSSPTSFIFNTSLPTDECKNHTCVYGNCSQGINQFYCSCHPGYRGGNCEENIDDCAINPCQNGTCTDLVDDYNCTCHFGYRGRNCTEYIGQCFTKPCQNQGNCSNGTDTSYECACVPGWTGKNCSQDIDECAPQPCQNGGSCDNRLNEYKCMCPRGYSGTNCTITKNECESMPCQNGGKCKDLILDHNCTCPSRYNGKNCEQAPPACDSVVCISNAVCNPANLSCQCKPGFVGDGQTSCTLECAGKVVEYKSGGKKYNFTFAAAALSVTSLSNETCSSGRSIASAACVQSSATATPSALFAPPVVVLCETTTTDLLQSVDVTNITALDSAAVGQTLAEINVVTSGNVSALSADDAQKTIDILSAFGNTSASQVQVTPIDLFNTMAVISVVASSVAASNVSNTETKQQQAQQLVTVLQEFTKRIVIPPGQNSVQLATKDTSLQVYRPTKDSQNRTRDIVLERVGNTTTPLHVAVPGNITDLAAANSTNGTVPQVSFIVYLNDNLFPSTDPNNKATTIVSVAVGDLIIFPGQLETNVTFEVNKTKGSEEKLVDNPTKAVYTDLHCGIWDPVKNLFVIDEGCRLVEQPNHQECFYAKPGSYSLLFREETFASSFAQQIFSEIGLWMSCLGLALTIIIYLTVPELRSRQPSIFLLNICFCLLVSNLLFLFGISNIHNSVPCYVTTVLLHYFLLATWCWMSANGYNMYRALVQVLGARSNRAWKLSAVFSYVTPAFIVVLTAGVTLFHLDQQATNKTSPFFESHYRARNMCWLQIYSLRYAFIIPVAILSIANVLFCSSILVHLTCKRKEVQSSAAARTTKNDMLVAATLIVMLGITWIFGFLMLVADDTIYLEITSWLFCIFNIFQGLIIFVLNCVRQPNVRALWLHPVLKFVTCGKYQPVKTATIRSSSSAGAQFTSQTNASSQKI